MSVAKKITLLMVMGAVSCHARAPSTIAASSQLDHNQRAVARFEKPLSHLEPVLFSGKPSDELVEEIMKTSLRDDLFRIEGLLRLYRSAFEKEAGELLMTVKAFEDALGKYGESRDLIVTVQKVGAPQKFLSFVEQKEKLARAVFVQFLQSEGWLKKDGGKIEFLRSRLAKMDWASKKKDREYLVSEIESQIKTIEKKTYDLSDLENGIHELRRDLRWLPIYSLSLDGALVLGKGKCPLEQFEPLVHSPLAESKFNILPANDEEKHTCEISQCLFLGMSSYIEKFGAIKNFGQAEEFLAAALLESGMAKTMTEAKQMAAGYGEKIPNQVEVHEAARVVYDDLKRSGIFPELRKELKSCQ